jgi:hypothetical protein
MGCACQNIYRRGSRLRWIGVIAYVAPLVFYTRMHEYGAVLTYVASAAAPAGLQHLHFVTCFRSGLAPRDFGDPANAPGEGRER